LVNEFDVIYYLIKNDEKYTGIISYEEGKSK